MANVGAVLTLGLGTFGSVNHLLTLGYGLSVTIVSGCVAAVDIYQAGSVALESYQGGSKRISSYQGGTVASQGGCCD